jgi:hypothetical protein
MLARRDALSAVGTIYHPPWFVRAAASYESHCKSKFGPRVCRGGIAVKQNVELRCRIANYLIKIAGTDVSNYRNIKKMLTCLSATQSRDVVLK